MDVSCLDLSSQTRNSKTDGRGQSGGQWPAQVRGSCTALTVRGTDVDLRKHEPEWADTKIKRSETSRRLTAPGQQRGFQPKWDPPFPLQTTCSWSDENWLCSPALWQKRIKKSTGFYVIILKLYSPRLKKEPRPNTINIDHCCWSWKGCNCSRRGSRAQRCFSFIKV